MRSDTLKRIRNFNKERDWSQFHTPENLAKSIAIEAGELLELFQWSDNADMQKVQEELADVLIYAYDMADACGLNVDEIVNSKINKNEDKYPVDKAKGNSKKHTELHE